VLKNTIKNCFNEEKMLKVAILLIAKEEWLQMQTGITSIQKFFQDIVDPRVKNRSEHLFMEILIIALLATLAGAENFNEIESFAKSKEAWLHTFLALPGGIPSHDTFNRFFSLIRPEEFSKCFIAWTQALAQKIEGIVAIDGKTLRGSFDSASKTSALHMVSAWSSENELVLGQIRTAAKSNEITAIPQLIAMLDLKGSIVTIDAMGCQKEIARDILNAGADYVLSLKGNQGNTLESVKYLFEWEEKNNFRGFFCTQYESVDKDHGRIETRKAYSIDVTGMEKFKEWPGLESVTKLVSVREIIGQATTTEVRYYLSSLPADAEKIGTAVRSHWGIENSLHWILDVNFGEDYARNRKGHSAENMAILRHMVVNLIKKERSSKTSFRGKRRKASWNNDYLITLLS
jgi:predicted transposase YbfD/YdcC